MDKIIHVALASDRNYLPYAAMVMAGVAEYTKRSTVIHFLYESLEDADFKRFDFLAGYPQITLQRHKIKDAFFEGWPEMRWSRAIYYRLMLPDLLPGVKKLIYLDCDLAVLDDLGKLFDEDLSGKLCMAVITKTKIEHAEKLGILPAEYFNSGVLVFSPMEWKNCNLTEKFKKCFERYADILRYPDQDILNIVLHKQIKVLHPRWNIITSTYRNPPVQCYSESEVKEALNVPGIVHYTGKHKPWKLFKSFHHPYSAALRHFAEISGQRKIAAIIRVKSMFLPYVAKVKKELPWDERIINRTWLK